MLTCAMGGGERSQLSCHSHDTCTCSNAARQSIRAPIAAPSKQLPPHTEARLREVRTGTRSLGRPFHSHRRAGLGSVSSGRQHQGHGSEGSSQAGSKLLGLGGLHSRRAGGT